MTEKDWHETGDRISSIVQDAVDSGDFSKLSSAITQVVNDAADSIGDALRGSASGGDFDVRGKVNSERQRSADRIRREMEEKSGSSAGSEAQSRRKAIYQPASKANTPQLIAGRVMKWTGYGLAASFALTEVILAAVGAAAGISMTATLGIFGVLFAGSMALGLKGNAQTGRIKRFRKYLEILGERTFCQIEEFASAIGRDTGFVRKDLKKMMRLGYFKQAYLDRKETLLITDQGTYQQYLKTQDAYEARTAGNGKSEKSASKKEERQSRENIPNSEHTAPEYQELFREGRTYIDHIHACNDRIEDAEISKKLDRMETLVSRIFIQASQKPESSGDLKKLMNYYLPTTKKLLDAYCELDEQPIQGQNIVETKTEIAEALNSLNSAFETMLDDLFEDQAWDISSDISVLNTMLAQEGLTGSDFGKK